MNRLYNPAKLGSYSDPKSTRFFSDPRFLWWPALSKATSAPILKGYQVFLILVPFAATIIESLSGVANIQLPITWFYGYLSGISFFIAMSLVGIWCPEPTRSNRTFTELKSEGRTMQYIIQELREVYLGIASVSPSRANHYLRGIVKNWVRNPDEFHSMIPEQGIEEVIERDELWDIVNRLEYMPDKIDDLFWNIQWYAGSTHYFRRVTCFTFILIGAAFALVLMISQSLIVLRSV